MRILMLVANPCLNDTRVIKEAEALASAGHNVTVLCRYSTLVSPCETINGVKYKRVNMYWGDRMPPSKQNDRKSVISGANNSDVSYAFESKSKKIYSKKHISKKVKYIRYYFADNSVVHKIVNYILDNLIKIYSFIFRKIKILGYITGLAFNVDDIMLTAREINPDVVHAHDLATLPLSALVAKSVNAQLVYDAHELEAHRNGHNWLKKRICRLTEGKYINDVARVITVCDSIADHLAKDYKIERPLVVLNTPDGINLVSMDTDIRSAIGLDNTTPLVVYVGKITFGRGLKETVQALQHDSTFHFAMLGPVVESVVNEIEVMAQSLGVNDRVHFAPPVKPHEVLSFVRTADVGVIAIEDVCLSYRYCLPNKLFELTFGGIPVCVSDLPELSWFVNAEGVGVVMDQTDPADIARAMRWVYEHRSDYVLSEERVKALEAKYSWRVQAQKLIDFYATLEPGTSTKLF